MKAFTWIAACAVMLATANIAAAQTGRMAISHYEPLQRLHIGGKSAGNLQKAGHFGSATLSFDALGNTFKLQLEPNRPLLEAASGAAGAEAVAVYRGSLDGMPDSWVRIVVHEGAPSGLMWDGEQMYAIEAPQDSSLSITAPVIYRLADTHIQPGSVSCGMASMSGNGAATLQKLVGELGASLAQGPGATQEINLGAIGDFEFTSAKGGDSAAAAAILTRLNNVDGIFSQQLGVQLTVREIETFSTAADPFSDTGRASDLLEELANYRSVTPNQRSQGLTHLYTGRDLDTTTVGIAYRGVLCDADWGAGLSEGNGSVTFDSLVAAHEIGHNFGAPHDTEAGSPCESESGGFIMAPSLNGSDQFSACSILNMQDDVDRAACITALPSVDMAVSLRGGSPDLLFGADQELTYDVDNIGTMQATNVSAEFSLPANLTFDSVSASAGSCANASGTVSCSLGNVPGSSSRTVTISVTATSVGAGTLGATVSADVDDRPANNAESIGVTVDPAVDLVVNLPSQSSINIDQSTTVRASLENRSILNATGVSITVSANNGLRVDSASWGLGSCTITGQQIDCGATNFAGQSATTLEIGFTGVTSGSRGYTVEAQANEADSFAADNSASSSIRVRDGSGGGNSSDDDSGGGAAGPLLLWMLGLGALLARRARRSTA